jgi:thiol-disulfide isomerase/thioredoxin
MVSRMSTKTFVVVAIVIIAVGATVGIALSRNSFSPSDLTLPIITWNETTLSTLEGTPVVLNFWSISCGWCTYQLPFLEAVAQQSEGELEVIAINMRDSALGIRSFFREYEPAMTIALDENSEAFRDYCLAYNNTRGATPFTLFLDSEGMVQYVKIGAFASEAALWETLHDALRITVPQTS